MRSPGSAPSALRQWLRLLAEGEVKPRSFVAPALLMLFASALEGLSIALLVPTLAGLLERDFTGLTRFPGLDLLHQRRPDLFAPGDTTLLPALLVTIAAVVLLKVIVFFRARLLFATKALRLADTWRQRLVRRYLGLGKRFFDEHNAGYLQSIILTHASQLGQAASTFGLALNHAMTIAIFGALMLWLSWQLTLLVVALFPLLYFSLSRLVRRIKSQSEHMWRAQRSLSELTFNLLTCVPLVKAYHQERREGDRFAALSTEVARLDLGQQRRLLFVGPIQELLLLGFVAVLVLFVARFSVDTPANFLVFFYVLKRSSTYVTDINHLRAELARLSESLSFVLDGLTDPTKPVVAEGAREFLGLRERIEFDRLSFSFSAEGPQVLSRVSFDVRRGTTTAIVGRSGSGKSTLISLLMRYYEAPPGAIRLDGVDIREFTHASLRRHIALVPQDCQLFNASIRDNLTYGLERSVAPPELAEALRGARLEELVQRLPEGLDTQVGDRGVKLSGGEKQRLAIARALLKGSSILILDEATSALDSRTEQLVQEAVDECLEGRTAIVVAHRLATIQHADEIVLIEDGVVIERGSLEELLAARGAFHAYWEAQRFEPRAGAARLAPLG